MTLQTCEAILDCGGKQSATPLFEHPTAFVGLFDFLACESAVAAAALPAQSMMRPAFAATPITSSPKTAP